MNTFDFSERIKEVRKLLNLTQADAGALCGVSRETWGLYERGKLTPGGDVLASFAAAGADVQYILTGIRNKPAEIKETPANYTVLAKKRLQNIAEELPEDDLADLVKLAEDKKQKNDYKAEIEEFKRRAG